MDWNTLEKHVYYKDGSLRDIYIQNININDWKKWVNYINKNHPLTWYNGKTQNKGNTIDFECIREYLNAEHDLCSLASFYLGKKQINCHFFDASEIENDINPREFHSIDDHNALLQYMVEVSSLLEKEVILTPEDTLSEPLVKVFKERIEYIYEATL